MSAGQVSLTSRSSLAARRRASPERSRRRRPRSTQGRLRIEDDGAEPHVKSEHFAKMQREFPQYLAATPKIVSRQVDGDGWEEMGELQVG